MDNILDEYDRGEPERDQRRLTVRWKAVNRNVMTDDGPEEKALHIATFASPVVAAHITELHNRTFGDGQGGPEDTSGIDAESLAKNWGQGAYPRPLKLGWDCGITHNGEGHTHLTKQGADECLAEQRSTGAIVDPEDIPPARREAVEREAADQAYRKLMAGTYGEADRDRLVHELRNAREGLPLAGQPDGTVNARRPYLPDDLRLSRRYGPGVQEVEVSIRNGVERLLQELVNRRVAEWMAREPARIAVDLHSSPDLLVNILRGLGYTVTGPLDMKADPR
jgi:hypothetical protein